MEIELCSIKNNYLSGRKTGCFSEFTQSFEWGEFQKQIEREPVRFLGKENGIIIGNWQGFIHNLCPGINYLYFPRADFPNDFPWPKLIKVIHEFFPQITFIRVEPIKDLVILNLIEEIKKVFCRQPKQTLFLDISKTEENLLKQMHSKTRYNIRLAENKGVEIKEIKDINLFWKLNKDTVKRDKFKSHKKSYYEKMLAFPFCRQLNAFYKENLLASAIFIQNKNNFVYLHGASANSNREMMAPYLIQWEGIKLAKKLNCLYYDFWGVSLFEKKSESIEQLNFNNFFWNKNNSLSGVTRFKAGFGGEYKVYGEAFEIVLNEKKYRLFSWLKRILAK